MSGRPLIRVMQVIIQPDLAMSGCSVCGCWQVVGMTSRHVSGAISVAPELVYELEANPENLPKRAAGLVKTEVIRKSDVALVDSPMGKVTVRFVPRNQ